MRTMVLVYLPTKLGDFVRANVGKYSSTMEHVGVHLHVAKIIEASFFPLDELNGWCKAHVSCDMLAFEPLNKQMEIQVKPKLYTWHIFWSSSKNQWNITHTKHIKNIFSCFLHFFHVSASENAVQPNFNNSWIEQLSSGWWFQPLWKIWLRHLGWYSQYMENKNVPNHQPVNWCWTFTHLWCNETTRNATDLGRLNEIKICMTCRTMPS